MYLSYSGYKTWTLCPRQYWFKYIERPKLEEPDNRVNSLFGTVVGGVFEAFYNEKLWTGSPGVLVITQRLLDRVQPTYIKAIARETRDGVIRWKPEDKAANYASPDALLEDVRATIPRGIRTIQHHRLLDKEAAAEVKLDREVEGHTIAGRCDFLMRRIGPHHDLILLDGKGSKYRDKYVDHRQLKWYAMLHRIKYGHAPDRLGFVFWRFEPDKSVDWVECSRNDLDELQGTILEAIHDIEAAKTLVTEKKVSALEAFPARPGNECRFCAYKPLCAEGKRFDELSVPEHVGSGVEDVGL